MSTPVECTRLELHLLRFSSVVTYRNVTVTAYPDEMPLVDFKFIRSAVHLCATCIFHMRDVSVANERRGNGAAVDFFVGDPGSVLVLEDSLRLRLACTTTGVWPGTRTDSWDDGRLQSGIFSNRTGNYSDR